ncbi:hypothetical protein ADIS_1201 [Lunatimonas lonarensis]|uniref:Uncharacterized protein n=1 Tax=Lunatimonas lonarensis TaxID=1232681 RepID=R7ZWE4_9BACT|nr:hypothetical protein ADIS_1201 [Lunatimonas lonarensis]
MGLANDMGGTLLFSVFRGLSEELFVENAIILDGKTNLSLNP